MVNDNLEACLQAYQFAELALGNFASKSVKDQHAAVAAAEQLQAEVAAAYERVLASDPPYPPARLGALQAMRARLQTKLADAKRQTPAL